MINFEHTITESARYATNKAVSLWPTAGIGGLFSSMCTLFLEDHGAMALSIVIILGIDWLTGFLAALRRGEKLSSSKMMNGFIKILLYMLGIFGAIQVDRLVSLLSEGLSHGYLANFIIGYIGLVEIISILENLKSAGLKVPDKGMLGTALGPLGKVLNLVNDVDQRPNKKEKDKDKDDN